MNRATILVLQCLIAVCLVGSVVVQVVLLPLVWADFGDAEAWGRVVMVGALALIILSIQVCAVCVWRLLSLVRREKVFSTAAFRFVNVIIGGVSAAAVLIFVLAVALAPGGAAPGLVGLLCCAALAVAGVALLVVVMRSLLSQAIDRDSEARALRTELDEVV